MLKLAQFIYFNNKINVKASQFIYFNNKINVKACAIYLLQK